MDRNVNIISGPTLSGKSYLLEQILHLPDYQDAVVIRMDDIRKRYWGERDGESLTVTEKIYRNLLTFREVETKLIVDGASTIFVEVPMLTRVYHQQPLVETLREAQWYLQAIEQEQTHVEDGPITKSLSEIKLNVVLLYCSVKAAHDRLERRQRQVNTSNTDVFSIDMFLEVALDFELPEPKTYIPLMLNTSDESPEAERRRLQEVVSFFSSNKLVEPRNSKKQFEEAEGYLEEARSLAHQRGIRKAYL